MSKKNYYIVRVKNLEMKAYNGSVLTREDAVTYLAMSDGYPTHSRNREGAKKFDAPPTKEEIAKWDGMPWYNRIKCAEVIPVEETLIHEIVESEAIPVE